MAAAGSRRQESSVSSQAEIEEMGQLDVKYMPPHLDRIENVEAYQEGGYCPIHLNDQLNDGQYTIIHKLGHGGFATVWLARDTKKETYVAVKILMAEASEDAMNLDIKVCDHIKERLAAHTGSQYLDLPIGHFWTTSPNGRHLCILSNVEGPSIEQISHAHLMDKDVPTLGPQDSQILSLQIVQALEFLHSSEVAVVHGDLTSSNILLGLKGFGSIPEQELIRILGIPVRERIQAYGCHELDGSAPEFVYEAVNTMRLLPYWTGSIKIIDFGASYFLKNPPKALATPLRACAPEYLRDGKFGKESDVWAFAGTLYEMRAGHPLIKTVWGGKDEALFQTETIIGPLPLRMGDETKSSQVEAPLLKTLVTDIQNQTLRYGGDRKCYNMSYIPLSIHKIQKRIRKCRMPLGGLTAAREKKDRLKIAPEEAEAFHDLLSKLFN